MKMSTTLASLHKSTHYPPSLFPRFFPFPPSSLTPHDPSPASEFYQFSRLVNHIDDHAIAALGQFYRGSLKGRVLDVCSSWVSHIPPGVVGEVVGVGMNPVEMGRNGVLGYWLVHDLNTHPRFSSSLASSTKGKAWKEGNTAEGPFDAVICNVSIDYLTRPLEVLEEVGRVLQPGGWAYLAISNRCFPTKVVKPWLNLSTTARLELVASYFHFAGTTATSPQPPPTRTHMQRLFGGPTPSILAEKEGASTPAEEEGPPAEGGIRPGQIFELIEALEIVGEGEGWDPLWVVRARRRAE